jgi:drug/metabolite transporter (DMT)-like permease
MSKESVSRPALLLVLGIAILAVSTASILIRLAQDRAPSLTIAALRLLIATVVLAPLALTKHRVELRGLDRRYIFLACVSGAFLAAHFAAWITSLEYTNVASSVVLVSTGPLWVALLSPLFLGERLGRGTLLGLFLALLGGVAISAGDLCTWNGAIRCDSPVASFQQGTGPWGNLLALFGAWSVTGYLIIGRRVRQVLSLVPYIFLVYGVAAIILVVVAISWGQLRLALPASTYLWILLLGLVPQLIGHSAYNWALGFLPATFVAVTTLGEPIGSVILAYVLLHEAPGILVLLGALLILAGIYLAASTARQNAAADTAD